MQPAPIIAPLVEGKPDSVVTSSVWRLWFQGVITSSVQRFFINASSVPQSVNIDNYTNVSVSKVDSTANTVALVDSTAGRIQPWGPISNQNECLHLVLSTVADPITGLYSWIKE